MFCTIWLIYGTPMNLHLMENCSVQSPQTEIFEGPPIIVKKRCMNNYLFPFSKIYRPVSCLEGWLFLCQTTKYRGMKLCLIRGRQQFFFFFFFAFLKKEKKKSDLFDLNQIFFIYFKINFFFFKFYFSFQPFNTPGHTVYSYLEFKLHYLKNLKLFSIRIKELFAGLISRAVKTYFDRKAVKPRLKPVKTGLNQSKRGQNLKLRNT